MHNSLDSVFGIHAKALALRAQRSEVLASNLANADTPNYKAKDIDFSAALNKAQHQQATSLSTTHGNHRGSGDFSTPVRTLYRTPNQPSLDGNTVDSQVEQANFAENAVRYQVSLRFLSGKIQGLMTAIRGE